MAKKSKKSNSVEDPSLGLAQQQMTAQSQMFNLDLDERRRQADMQNAQFIAEQMRVRMTAEMQARGYLLQPVRDPSGVWTGEFAALLDGSGQPIPTVDAARQARELALQEGEFELTKIRAERDYGLTYQDQQFRQAMDTRRQQWTEQYQRAQTMLAEGDLTGYYNGMSTLDRQKWEADASGYMPTGQATLARQQAEWNAVLNAPRGPADYHAYMNRMRGLQAIGQAPGVIGNLIGGGPIAAVSGNPNQAPMPMSNTQLAMGLVYGQPRGYAGSGPPVPSLAAGMQGGWQGQAPTVLPGGGQVELPGSIPPGQAPGGGTGGAPGSVLPQFPWQSAPGGTWTPQGGSYGGAYGSGSVTPQGQQTLAQAIYGQGLQGVGSFNIDQMSQSDFDAFLQNLHGQGSSWDDPRIAQIASAARSAGYSMGAYDGWRAAGNGQPWGAGAAAQPSTAPSAALPPPSLTSNGGTLQRTYAPLQAGQTAPPSSATNWSTALFGGGPPVSDSAPTGTGSPGGSLASMFGNASYGGAYGTPQPYTGARNWSAQQFRKLSPVEQQYTLGWNAEENAETPEDAQWLLKQGSPNFRRARAGRFAEVA